jgi:hypothetical protein
MENIYKILMGKTEGKIPLGELDVDSRIMLDWA